MNAIPVLTIEDVATLDGVLADFLKKGGSGVNGRDRPWWQCHFAISAT